MDIVEFLDKYDLCKPFNDIKKYHTLNKFNRWISKEEFSDFHFSLYPFAILKPLCFFRKEDVDNLIDFLVNNKEKILKNIIGNDKITHSILSLLRKGPSWEHEDRLSIDEPKDLEEFEHLWHPEYLRYCEHIYNHLINILSGLNEKSNNVNNLKDLGLKYLTNGYNRIIRNALSHGTVSFKTLIIEYRDRDKIEELIPSDFAYLFDELVYACNTIVISLIIFIAKIKDDLTQTKLENLPVGFKFLFIKGVCEQKDFEIISMLHTEKQLNINCKTAINNRQWHYISTLRIALKSKEFGRSKYIRFANSINFGYEVSALFIIDGIKLNEAIEKKYNFTRINEVFEETLMDWYDLKLKSFRNYFWKQSLLLSYEIGKKKIKELKEKELSLISKKYFIKDIEVIDSGKERTIESFVVLLDENLPTDFIVKILFKVFVKLKKDKTPKIDFITRKTIRKKAGRIRINIYKNDFRLRTLKSMSYKDNNFILRAEYVDKKFPYKPSPKNIDFQIKELTIKLNSNFSFYSSAS